VAPLENDGSSATMHMVTDQWWLTVTANQAEDQWMSVPLSDLTGVSVGKRPDGLTRCRSRPRPAASSPASRTATTPLRSTISESGAGRPRNAAGASPHIHAEPQGNWATPERVAKMGDTHDPDETVHYMFKGGTIDVEGSTSGMSMFGNDRDRKSAIRGILMSTACYALSPSRAARQRLIRDDRERAID
jgi:hypothetical protein